MLLQVLRISGMSLSPAYRDGDFVWVSKIPISLRGLRPGDLVVVAHPRLGRLIKLVDHLEQQRRFVYLVGLNDESVDSRVFGALPVEWVTGKVFWHIPQT